jgi:hypothetical protein
MFPLLPALALCAALLAGYLLCRLWCAQLPALLGATAWTFSDAMLQTNGLPGAGSALLVPLVVAGVFSRARAGRAFLVLGLACAAFRLGGARVSGGVLEALVLSVLAAFGAQRLWDGEGGPAFLLGAAVAAGWTVLAISRGLAVRAALTEAVPLGAAILLVGILTREARARAGRVALVALFAAQRALELALAAGSRLESTPIVLRTTPGAVVQSARP